MEVLLELAEGYAVGPIQALIGKVRGKLFLFHFDLAEVAATAKTLTSHLGSTRCSLLRAR